MTQLLNIECRLESLRKDLMRNVEGSGPHLVYDTLHNSLWDSLSDLWLEWLNELEGR